MLVIQFKRNSITSIDDIKNNITKIPGYFFLWILSHPINIMIIIIILLYYKIVLRP